MRKEFDGGTLDATFHDYFTPAWQLAEVRQDGLSGDGVLEQYLWDMAPSGYIDCLVLRDRDTNDDGVLDERLYAQQDAIYNVASVLDTSGDVQERYLFDPYGTRTFLDPGFDPRTASDFAWRVGSQRQKGSVLANEQEVRKGQDGVDRFLGYGQDASMADKL